MITLTAIKTDHKQYGEVEKLMNLSFPQAERRDNDLQRFTTDNNPLFKCMMITDNEEFIGLVTLWDLDSFIYVEHLATLPQCRNRGYGLQIIEQLKSWAGSRILVLEVEKPEDEMSRRRIGFYQRCGFKLCQKDYLQPPYRKGEGMLALSIMFAGTDNIDNIFESVKRKIYENAYQYTE